MAFELTPHRLVAMYDLCRAMLPKSWRLPVSDHVEFRTPARTDVCGKWHNGDPHVIIVSSALIRNKSYREALCSLLHEICHSVEEIAGKPVGHGAGFRRRVRVSADIFGFAEKEIFDEKRDI